MAASLISPKTVVISGASGYVGSALSRRLAQSGWRIRPLVRRPPRTADEISWNPSHHQIDSAALDGADAVVHLAGENIAKRWTAERRAAIRASRVDGTDTLARALASLNNKPAVMISGSATGFYGDRGDEILDESSPPGVGFLAGVCQAWEQASAPAADAGIRVVNIRTGVVFSLDDGALPKMLTPFKFGVGGKLGSGRQWMSWISLIDEVAAIEYLLNSADARGPVNLVSPNPVTNAEITRIFARELHRPAFFHAPAAVLKLALGEMADEMLLASQRVLPAQLARLGFHFSAQTVAAVLVRPVLVAN